MLTQQQGDVDTCLGAFDMKLEHEQEIRNRTAQLVLDWRNDQIGPIDNLDRENTLEIVGYADISLDESRIVLGRWVSAARRTGASWADIGKTIGISRQAAQQRFGGEEFPKSSAEGNQPGSVITRKGVTAFNERRVMDDEGRKRRRLTGVGFLTLQFVQTDKLWEHRRITLPKAIDDMIDEHTEQGWTHVASWSPFHYFCRELEN